MLSKSHLSFLAMSNAHVVKKATINPEVAASHPPVTMMIVESVKELKVKKRTNRQAILKPTIALHKIIERVPSVQVRRGFVSKTAN